MKHEIKTLPEPMRDRDLVRRAVERTEGLGYWQRVEAIAQLFGVGLLDANHVVRRHTGET